MTKLLIADDDERNLYFLRVLLDKNGYQVVQVRNGAEALEAALRDPPDALVSDVLMPVMDGFTLCREWMKDERLKNIPVVFYTATYTDSRDMEFALSLGASRFIVKPAEPALLLKTIGEVVAENKVKLHVPAPRPDFDEVVYYRQYNETLVRKLEDKLLELDEVNRALERDIADRRLAEQEQARLVTAIEQCAEGIFVTGTDWIIQYVNPAFERMSGYEKDQIMGQHARILKSGKQNETFVKEIHDTLAAGKIWFGRLNHIRKDGRFYEVEATVSPVRDKTGAVINYVSIHRDISREVKIEKELHQAQKMEAIGTLAGGIAHDFNNILAAIIGFTELALSKVEPGSPIRKNLEHVLKSGSRATDLVRQILTFSRQTEKERKPMQLGPVVKEVLKLLRSTLPTTIEMSHDIAVSEDDTVLADPTQIHQVLMNLCTNAAHAMRAKGGVLVVKLSNVTVDASLCTLYPDMRVGPHVCLTVSDTGHGMDAEVLERIFDPYFTTKGLREGTGLGLAVVQGIVKSHDGAITVYSEPGKGTTFSVFLPRIQEQSVPESQTVETLPTGDERILFVDDEQALVDLGREMLESLGYHVVTKADGMEALKTFRADPRAFDLVITDMTMPGLTGVGLSAELIAIRADIPIVLCSGFSELINEKQAQAAGIREFIMKPYPVADLANTVRRALAINEAPR